MIKAVIFDMYETLITHYHSPLYFGAQMAEDAGISQERFQELWEPTGDERTIGKMTLEEAVAMILRENDCFSDELLQKIVDKRVSAKIECFRHLHTEILPMLTELKKRGILIGLISNCFSEEVGVIRESVLFPYFNAVFLSYEQGIQKPDEEIFIRCMKELGVEAEACLYVGDGGSSELEAADKLGMTAAQAVWYLKERAAWPSAKKPEFRQLESPLEVLDYLG